MRTVNVTLSLTTSKATSMEVPDNYQDVALVDLAFKQGLFPSDLKLEEEGWVINEAEVVVD